MNDSPDASARDGIHQLETLMAHVEFAVSHLTIDSIIAFVAAGQQLRGRFMSINSVANPGARDLMHRHGHRQVGQMNAANTNTHIAIRYPNTLGAQRARFSMLMYTDLIPIARNQLIRNTRMTGRSVGNPTHDPCPPAQLTRRNHEQQPKPSNPV
jgi:hypothetical protein